jgi:hypothetical protein
MRSRFPDGTVFAVTLGALLIVGLFSLRLIPFYEPLWGLDLQNVYAYQTCDDARESGIYSVSGDLCGDEKGRSFVYPPAMFHAFFWVGWFTFGTAVLIWNFAMVASMLAVGVVWLWMDGRPRAGWRTVGLAIFWLLLLAQFPFAFALERSNNDVLPVVLWTAAAALFVGRRIAASGAAAGLAIILKVYPLVSFAIVFVGAIRVRLRLAAVLGIGCVLGALVGSVPWWPETVEYATRVLPELAELPRELSISNHVLDALPLLPVVRVAVGLALVGSWFLAASTRLDSSPSMVFAGALAISTYFSSISWDYNLITAYPLLLLVTARALDPTRSPAWKVASLGAVLALAAGRGVFTPAVQLLAQVVVLVAIAWLVIADRDEAVTSPRRAEAGRIAA